MAKVLCSWPKPLQRRVANTLFFTAVFWQNAKMTPRISLRPLLDGEQMPENDKSVIFSSSTRHIRLLG